MDIAPTPRKNGFYVFPGDYTSVLGGSNDAISAKFHGRFCRHQRFLESYFKDAHFLDYKGRPH